MKYVSIMYSESIPKDKIPNTVDLPAVTNKFSQHSYHLGSWTDTLTPNPTPLPEVRYTTHVVNNVNLNEDGGFDVSYRFLSTPCGLELMKKFEEVEFELFPVISDDGKDVVRFDFIHESIYDKR